MRHRSRLWRRAGMNVLVVRGALDGRRSAGSKRHDAANLWRPAGDLFIWDERPPPAGGGLLSDVNMIWADDIQDSGA
jgi:hypothetical protein